MQFWWREGSSLWATSFPQVMHGTWFCLAEHRNPFLSAIHYRHLSSSSSEALKSEETLASTLPLPLLPLGAGGGGGG